MTIKEFYLGGKKYLTEYSLPKGAFVVGKYKDEKAYLKAKEGNRKEHFERQRKAERAAWESAWGEWQREKPVYLAEISKQEAEFRAGVPKVKLSRRQMMTGQRGYIPLAKRRPYVRAQARAREKLFKPFQAARSEIARAEKQFLAQKPR